MIKLFWNTHNEVAPILGRTNIKEATTDFGWGIYHKENSDKWIFNILKKIKFKTISDVTEIEENDTLILIDSNIERKSELYTKLKLLCSNLFLIHLGDESGIFDLSQIYNNFNFVWRTFCSNKYFNNTNISCIPLGYKSGTNYLSKKDDERKYKWSFMGTPHKSSRHDLLHQLSDVSPSYVYKTEKFNKTILGVKEMSQILSSTKFIPCPNGFVHPETYRVYEALECGCIPIVENAYNYYDRLFPNNPFVKIDKWQEAKLLINEWKETQVLKKQSECTVWWNKYKDKLQNFVKEKIYP
tara:strand:- start:5529 stop:6422 length:894 start_codon:yes stop_codon:yes gene_type:complete